MNKKQAILIFLLLILFSLVLYLIFTSESVKETASPDNSGGQIKQDNSAILETDYKLKAKEFFSAYESLIKNNSFTEKNITELKDKLLGLKVPVKFKELHIRFVLALTKMENYLSQKDETEKSESLQSINQLKADYSWLND